MMVPVIEDLSQRTGLSDSKLFMPMSFASILGGASTLIGTSTNLIIAGLIISAGLPAMNIFAPTLVAVPAALIGITFLITIGNRFLPEGSQGRDDLSKRRYKAEFIITENSPLIGKTILEAGLAEAPGYQLVEFEPAHVEHDKTMTEMHPSERRGLFHRLAKIWHLRTKKRFTAPAPEKPDIDITQVFQPGDILTYIADNQSLPGLWTTIGIKPAAGVPLGSKRYTHHLVEVVVSPSHPTVGRYIYELPVRENPPYSAEIVAMSCDNSPPRDPLRDVRIQAGDVGVLEVEDDFFYQTRGQTEFSLTRRMDGYRIQRTSRATIAGVIMIAMVLLAAFNVMSMLNAALLGGLALLLTGSMTTSTAWNSIEWDTVVILGAAVGLSAAVTSTGLSEVIAAGMTAIGGSNPYVALVMVFIGCIALTNIITNAAAASIMFPVALAISTALQVSFTPFVVILMLGTSYAFINPAGYQTNLMVQEPGGYTFNDFVKLGLPLTFIAGLVVLILTPLIYQF